jgi:hypothetical protein
MEGFMKLLIGRIPVPDDISDLQVTVLERPPASFYIISIAVFDTRIPGASRHHWAEGIPN